MILAAKKIQLAWSQTISTLEGYFDAEQIAPTSQQAKEWFKAIMESVGLPSTFGWGWSLSPSCSGITPVHLNWNC